MEGFYTVKEAAKDLGFSEVYVRRLIKENRLHADKHGKSWIIPQQSMEDFIVGSDNTCRIQTVTQKQNEHFYNLISCFFDKTNVPILMNTSFNLGGEPLVETFDHAIHTLKNSMIEYLYLPEIETLVTVKNQELVYK